MTVHFVSLGCPKNRVDTEVMLGKTMAAGLAEGCDRPCAFCIIPKLSGPQRSRQATSVRREVESLAAAGTKEICLVAQHLTTHGTDLPETHGPRPTLASLLNDIARVGTAGSRGPTRRVEISALTREVGRVQRGVILNARVTAGPFRRFLPRF